MYWLLIILILIPQIARADCGWVLWLKIDSTYKTPAKKVELGTWNPNAAFDTLKECINSMYKSHALFKEGATGYHKMSTPVLMDNKMSYGVFWDARSDMHSFARWPSEVKPK